MAKKRTTTKIDVKSVSAPAVAAVPEPKGAETATEQSEVHVTHEQIAAKAKEIWVKRGAPAGQDLEIWLEAERVLRG